MSQVAQYVLKEHIESLLSADEIVLHPGNWGPAEDSFPAGYGTYKTIPNSLYLMPYIKTDNMQVVLFNKSYDKLSAHLHLIMDDLNRLNMRENTALWDLCAVDSIKPHEISARATALEQKEFIEGTEYFVGIIDIMFQYVEY